MDKKKIDRIVREEVAALLEAYRSRTPGTTGYRDFVGGRDRDDIEGIDRTTGLQKPWSTRGDYPRGGEDEPDDRTPEEKRQDRARARAAMDAEISARSAAYQASQPKQKHVMNRGEGPARRVKVNDDGSIRFPDMSRYDFLTNPANSDYALRDEVMQPGFSAAGAIAGYATVEYDAPTATWTVTGQIKDASKSHYGPTLGAGRTTVGKGPDVESAYRDMLSQSDLGHMLGGAAPLSESRWAKIAGLMTENTVSESKKFSSSTEGLSDENLRDAKKLGLEKQGDRLVGTMAQHKKFHKVVTKTMPSVDPFDPDDLDAVDEGAGAAPGSDPKRLPKPPNPKKDGPPGKEDLDAIKKLGPFERKKR